MDNEEQLTLMVKYQSFLLKWKGKNLPFNEVAIIWISKFAHLYRSLKERNENESVSTNCNGSVVHSH
jgi:hypothetical protein